MMATTGSHGLAVLAPRIAAPDRRAATPGKPPPLDRSAGIDTGMDMSTGVHRVQQPASNPMSPGATSPAVMPPPDAAPKPRPETQPSRSGGSSSPDGEPDRDPEVSRQQHLPPTTT